MTFFLAFNANLFWHGLHGFSRIGIFVEPIYRAHSIAFAEIPGEPGIVTIHFLVQLTSYEQDQLNCILFN